MVDPVVENFCQVVDEAMPPEWSGGWRTGAYPAILKDWREAYKAFRDHTYARPVELLDRQYFVDQGLGLLNNAESGRQPWSPPPEWTELKRSLEGIRDRRGGPPRGSTQRQMRGDY